MSHNSKLKQLLSSMNSRLKQASNIDEIYAITQTAIDFDGEIKFNHKYLYSILVFSLLVTGLSLFNLHNRAGLNFYLPMCFLAILSIFIFVMLFYSEHFSIPKFTIYITISIALLVSSISMYNLFHIDTTSAYLFMIFTVSVASIFIFGKLILVERSLISDLSRKLFESKLMFDINMTLISNIPTDTYFLCSEATEFNRGNHSRYFKSFWKIDHSEISQPAIYYHFHYVDKRTRTIKNSNGSRSTETVYTHNDRYGLIFDFAYAQGLSLNSNGITKNPVNYKPSYGEFLKRFQIGANSEQDAAKFLKAALVEDVVRLSAEFDGLNIQILNNKILFGFSDNMLEEVKQSCNLTTPVEFLEALQCRTDINNLKTSNELLKIFTRHLDNNFSINNKGSIC